MEQVVILGAGFDCRALRMKELENIPVFEVDRAAMIARKERMMGGSHRTPGCIRRLGVDFQKDTLGNRLAEAGWSANLRTLFIWEGVTNYLDPRSVEALFARLKPNEAGQSNSCAWVISLSNRRQSGQRRTKIKKPSMRNSAC